MEDKNLNMEKLTEDELEKVAGGMSRPQYMRVQCSCGTINNVDVSKSSFTCTKCGKTNHIVG